MPDLETALAAQRTAANAFKAAALKVSDSLWNVPRAPGKWSPAQVTDHVGVSTKVACDAMTGRVSVGSIPFFLRPLANRLFFQPVLKKGFPAKGKAPAIFAPAHDPMPRDQLCTRIDSEVNAFESEARAMAKAGRIGFMHGFFGRIAVADYVMFNARHFDHHRAQLPGA